MFNLSKKIGFNHQPVFWWQWVISIGVERVSNSRNIWRGIVAEAFYNLSPITELGVILLILDYSGDTPSNNVRAKLINYINNCYVMYCYYFEANYFPVGDVCVLHHHMGSTGPRVLLVKKTGNTIGQVARFRSHYFMLHKKCVGILARSMVNYLKALGLSQEERDSPGCIAIRNCETMDCRHFIVLWDCCYGVIV
jgi:hypothetical protein